MLVGASPPRWDFYLAYPDADLPAAERLYDLLSPHARVFLASRALVLGDRELAEAQQASLLTVVFMSPRADPAWYRREDLAAALALAQGQGQRVMPVYLGDDLPDYVPYGLHHLAAVHIRHEGSWFSLAERLMMWLREQTPLFPPTVAAAAGADGLSVFCLAARGDREHVAALRKHLYPAQRASLVRFTSSVEDSRTGDDQQMDRSLVLLLLLSERLFTDEPERLERALQRARDATAWVVPIRIDPYDSHGGPLAQLVTLPREGAPVGLRPEADAVWAAVATEIRVLAQRLVADGQRVHLARASLRKPV